MPDNQPAHQEVPVSGAVLEGQPEWWKYETSSERVYVSEPLSEVPLVPNHPDADSYDNEPQRLVPLYMDFEKGEVFFYEQEARDLLGLDADIIGGREESANVEA